MNQYLSHVFLWFPRTLLHESWLSALYAADFELSLLLVSMRVTALQNLPSEEFERTPLFRQLEWEHHLFSASQNISYAKWSSMEVQASQFFHFPVHLIIFSEVFLVKFNFVCWKLLQGIDFVPSHYCTFKICQMLMYTTKTWSRLNNSWTICKLKCVSFGLNVASASGHWRKALKAQ